ncbi:MAG TPA: hypothetical protein VH234_03195 [Candidatus Saccharimonadales bacterium]|jgi:hypothetical protein|nr:hypothetical protein [Candidatus Saccharimonadales bacterium]
MEIKKVVKRFKEPLLVLLVVIIANSLFLTGLFKSNPIDQFSGSVTYTHVGLYGVYSTIDPNNAYTTQALGHEGVSDILHGHMPWWNYNEQVGAPLAGDMQSAALFLPFNLLLALSSGVLFFHMALEIVAGISTYYLLKKLRCSEAASIVGGSLFALNGTFAWFGSANVNPIAFLPLLILGIEIALEKSKKSQKGGWGIIAIALALSLYAGFPEAAYLDGILAGVWFIVRALQNRNTDWLIFTKKVFAGLFTGLLLAAPILIAFADYLPFANIGGHSGALSRYFLPASTLPALVMPYIYGPIFQFGSYDHTQTLLAFWDNIGGYITLPLVFLALIGTVFHDRKNRALVYALAAFSVVVVARNYGVPGMATLINLIPEMHRVAFYRYVNPTLELAVVVLAMLGLDTLLGSRKKPSDKKLISVGAVVLLVVICLLPLAIGVDHNLYLAPHHRLFLAASVAWSIGTIMAMLLTILYFKKYAKYLLPIIILVDALVMFIAPQLSAPRSTVLDLKPVSYLQKNLGNSRFYSIGYIMPNYGSYYGIASINTNNVPIAESWSVYVNKHLNPNVNPSQEFTGIDKQDPNGITPVQAFFANLKSYEQIGVKYVVIRNGLLTTYKPSSYSLNLVYSDSNFQIYQLPNTKAYFQAQDIGCSIYSSSRESLIASCSKPATLVRQELYMPGWTANVNSKPVSIHKSGELFESLDLPSGQSKIEFHYTPPNIVLAYLAFILGVGLLLASAATKAGLISRLHPKPRNK